MDTLVLDVGYSPIGRISWERAITLLWEGKIQIIEEYEDWTVRSVTLEIKVPSVVRWLRGTFNRKKAIKFSRENMYLRDKGRCQYCGNAVPRNEATYDHVNPRVAGGHTRWENIVISCVPCNQRKGGRNPEEAKMRLLSVPVRPKTLPGGMRMTFVWQKSMPESWKQWLKSQIVSAQYWNGALDED